MVTKTTEKKTFLERLRTNDVKNRESGLALLDVLIGMAIFALIALIALSSLSQYRQKAYMSGAQSDAKAIGTAVEAESINTGAYARCVTAATNDYVFTTGGTAGAAVTTNQSSTACNQNTGAGLVTTPIGKVTSGNVVLGYKVYTATGNRTAFKFCVQHVSNGTADAWATYDSELGGLIGSGTGGGCTSATWGANNTAGTY